MIAARLLASSFGASDALILVVVGILIALSAVLALSETALVRASRSRARALVEQGRRGAKSLAKLVESPEKFLTPVLLMVLICQLVSASLVSVEASRLFGALGVVVALVLQVVIIFVFAEAIPKQWAVRHSDRAALFAAPVISAVIAFPPVRIVASLLTGLSQWVITHLMTPSGPNQSQSDVTESELLALADFAVEEDVIEHEERALISSIIDFGDTIVREVMAPRPDIIAVERSIGVGAALEHAMASGLSRIPVYENTIDEIVGIAYTRDLMRAARDGGDDLPIETAWREAHFVPETKRVAPLLREMQREQFHLAVVVDEYGGTAGIVTLEDLIEELVGEISDEFDDDGPLFVATGENDYWVSAKMAVDEVNELLGTKLPVGDWDTIGGLVFHLKGQVPTEGERFDVAGLSLIPEQVQRRRIGSVRIRRLEPIGEAGEGAKPSVGAETTSEQ